MALPNPSLFLYGFQVTAQNSSIDFRAVSLGPILQATLNNGFYSLTSLGIEISRAMHEVDSANNYTVLVDRSINGGTENRVQIATDGSYLDLLFGSGPRAASTTAPLIGFNSTDYTGLLTYTGSSTAGTALIPNWTGKNYLSPDYWQKVFGQVNVSASGVKEAIVFNIQKFFQVEFMYIPDDTWVAAWTPLFRWMIQQREIEFTPDITMPSEFFEATLETSSADGKGLAFKSREMLSEGFPNLYDTGTMTFRVVTSASLFIGG